MHVKQQLSFKKKIEHYTKGESYNSLTSKRQIYINTNNGVEFLAQMLEV